MAFDFKKEFKSLYMPPKKPSIVCVPKMNFITVHGSGNPNDADGDYKKAVSALYSTAYTIRMSYKTDYKIDGFFEYVVPPLESFWIKNGSGETLDKSLFKWICAIRLPDFVGENDVAWAIETAQRKKGIDCSLVKLEAVDEGECVQAMHIGPFDDEDVTIAEMERYANENGYSIDISDTRLHHEIYLSDVNKVPPEKQKTVIRHPVKKL